MKFSKAVVATVIVLTIIFTAAVLYIFYQTRVEPVELIRAWFTFVVSELLALAGIKRKEVDSERSRPWGGGDE